jgi:NAD(P)-dependent dehydrogenase (short-subunit alcohol dehydrogenase family)
VLDLGLADQSVIVTGAAGGIGGAACEAFLQAGARVLAVDVAEDALQATTSQLKAMGEIHAYCADLVDREAVRAVIAEADRLLGQVDVLFNNASVEGAVSAFLDYPLDAFERVMDINVRSIFLTMQAVLPGMVARQSGAIINMGSTAASRGSGMLAGYAASKHAVLGLTRTVASEVAPYGVRVNALCPGPTATRMMDSIESLANPEHPSAVRDAWTAAIPRGRYAQPVEIAHAALLLASPLAINVVGAAFAADGGTTAV